MDLRNGDGITAEMVHYIIFVNFPESDFEPYEANPLYSLSPSFINHLLAVPAVTPTDRQQLLAIRLHVYEKNGCQIIERKNIQQSDFDVAEWFPNQTFKYFRELDEDCSFSITNKTSDLIVGTDKYYVTWLSKSNTKIHATGIHPSKTLLNIDSKRWALKFTSKTQYKIDGVGLRHEDCICMCITFQIESDYEKECFIISDSDSDTPTACRGLSYINDTLRIWGASTETKYFSVPLTNKRNKWWTVFVMWPATNEVSNGCYYINLNIHGEFSATNVEFVESITFLGTKNDQQKGFVGSIASLDVFRKKKEVELPQHLINLLINQQLVS